MNLFETFIFNIGILCAALALTSIVLLLTLQFSRLIAYKLRSYENQEILVNWINFYSFILTGVAIISGLIGIFILK